MELRINGENRHFPAPLTVAQLIETLGYAGKRIAVEKNGEIVPRGRHAEAMLAEIRDDQAAALSAATAASFST